MITKILKAHVKHFIHEFILKVETFLKTFDNKIDLLLFEIQKQAHLTHKNIMGKLELPSKNPEEKEIQEKIKKMVYSNHLNSIKAGKFKTSILCIRAWGKLNKNSLILTDDYDNEDYKFFLKSIKQLVKQIDESNFNNVKKNLLKDTSNFTSYNKHLFKSMINKKNKIFLIQMQIRDLIIDLIALKKQKRMQEKSIENQIDNYINIAKKEIIEIIKNLSLLKGHFEALVKDIMHEAFEAILKNPPEIYLKNNKILFPKELIQAIFSKFGQFMYYSNENEQSYEIFKYPFNENESSLNLKEILNKLKI